MADSLLFVTQVAPYRDGPPACTACSTRPRSASRRSPRCTACAARRVDDVRDVSVDTISPGPRARAVHDRRDAVECRPASAILERVRAGTLAVCAIHSATDSCYGWDEYGELVGARFDGHPWTQTFVADVRRPDASRVRAPRRRVDAGTTRCTSSAICGPTRRCCCGSATASSTWARRAHDRRRSATRSRGASPRARAGCSPRASGTSRRRGRRRRTCGTSPAGSAGRSATLS